MKNTPALIFGFALALALAPATRAAERFWGGGSGNITDNNWYSDLGLTTPAARGNGDVANIASGTVFVTSNATVYDTNIGLAAGDNAAVIVSGNWYNSGGELSIGGVGGTNAIFPAPTGGAGGLTILSSGSVRASTFYVGGYGSGTFHLAQGAKLTNHANAFLGRNAGGSGTATINGLWTIKGSSTNNGNLSIAHAVGSRGNLLTIGVTGTVIASANTASTNYFYIGPNRSTSGTVIVNGLLRIDGTNAINSIAYRGNNGTASDTAASGVLIIGQTGTVIFSGTETSLGHLGMASGVTYRANASGTVFVDGVWKNAGNLIVGRSGAGHLEIAQTGTVTVGTFLAIANGNSMSNASHTATGPVGGTVIVDGYLGVGDYFAIGNGSHANLHITENATVITGTNGTGYGHVQIGRNGSTVGTGTAVPVPGNSIVRVDGLLDVGGNFLFGMRNKSELTLGAASNILVEGNYYQNAQTLLAITPSPGPARDLPLVATAGSAYISGTLKITNINTLAGYSTAANATNSNALPAITVLSAGTGIEGEFKTISITPALTGTTGLPDYIYNGKTILGAPNGSAEYRVGQLLSWHAPAANAHGAFTIAAGNTFTLDTPLADRADASALATGWDGRSLTKRGPGTLVLADTGSRTGDTTIESGTLRVATPAASLGILVNNAVLDLGGSSGGHHTATASTLAGTGTLILAIDSATGDGDRLIITGDASGAYTVRVSIDGAPPTTPTPAQLTTVKTGLITVGGANSATFTEAATPAGVTVTFAPQGGSVTPAQQVVTPGAAYGELPAPVRAGFTFAGWFTAPNGGTPVTDTTIVASDATSHILHARWVEGNHPVITPDAGKTLYGSIIDDTGAPVPNVVVSDGFTCVKTNDAGIYQMTRNAKARVVFYSTPETHAVKTLGTGRTGYAWFSKKLVTGVNRYNFDLVRLPAPETDFMLLGIGDPQVTSLAQLKRFETETIADIGKLRQATPANTPIYAIMLGDIVGDNLHLLAPLRDIVNASPVTYFSVPGNHDHNQAYSGLNKDYESGEDYENICGPLNYSANIGNVHIIGLDDILYTKQSGYGTGLTTEILEWVKQDLSHVPKTKTIIVAYHIPLRGGTYQKAQDLFALLKDYADVHFMAGHTHYQQNITFTISGSTKNITAYEHIHGGACGAWWNSIVNVDGAPNGYGVYTISGTKITDWYSKPTGYSDTYQMRMYRGNASFGGNYGTYTYGRNANDVVVDIWNSDTTGKWKFAVYEDNVKVSDSLTKLSTSAKVDAYAAGYHVGVLGRTYDSSSNNHLYYHTLKNAAAKHIEIRATDRFGKTYSLSDFTTDLSEFPANFASPEITTQPADATVMAGNPATFTAVVSGTPKPSLKWQSSSDGATWTDISGATTASHTIPNATIAQNGTLYRLAATNARGLATSHAALLTVNPNLALDAAQTLKAQLQATGTATITVSGTVDLSLVGGATVAKGKTIVGADATSTISGNLTLAAGASDTIIRGVNFTTGALTINGANDVDVSHCTFTDAPVSITGNADNIAFSWNIFTATPAGTGSAMTISNAGASTGILLDHNLWGANLKNNMPGATNARVYMYNNYITATGNTTATIAGAGAQILSVRNIYQGVKNPLTKQSSGRLRTTDNIMDATTGTTATGDDKVFVPGYAHIIDSGDSNTAASITAKAGNTAGKNSATPAQTNGAASISATVTGSGANKTASSASVPHAGGFTLTGNATGFTPTARQWYRDNTAIVGATSATYAVTSATAAAHAGAYAVALTTSTGEIVTSGAFTVTVAAPPIDTPDTGNSSGGGGGGGAPSLLLLPALLLLLAGRTLRLSRKR
ncbi:putative repeat protein (TIGR02543 family) [Ereboglobus sp. PH5-5]|uniref:calcineurin-like phosphoesterase C-terminal domain-containing protein n=1 Tax=Ereboglobus sp. PH5-5 TaxID=2940529 RepID=UPI002406119F|nr:calcineurin-like phosphoesterase C-terminal domain-containing protein [Ereboglobus sp. PH5-5]MDF9832002.1 putative repeat protein (TIGR02543 family) [Ereboglobus sp. PH5-5]